MASQMLHDQFKKKVKYKCNQKKLIIEYLKMK